MRAAGLLGLVEASRRFDETLQVPFERYARIRVRGAIVDATRIGISSSRRQRQEWRELRAASDEMRASLGREPTDGELASALMVSEDEVRRMRASRPVMRSVSLVELGHDSIPGPESDRPDKICEQAEKLELIRRAVQALPDPHKTIMRRHVLGEERLQDLSDELGITCGRASQIRAEAVSALRSVFANRYDGVPVPAAGEPGVRLRAALVQQLTN